MQARENRSTDLQQFEAIIMSNLQELFSYLLNISDRTGSLSSKDLKSLQQINRKISRIKFTLKNLFKYSAYLHQYGDKSFEEASRVKKELNEANKKLKKFIYEVQSPRETQERQQQKIKCIEHQLQVMRCLNQLNVSFVDSFCLEIQENQNENSENSLIEILKNSNQQSILDESSVEIIKESIEDIYHCISQVPSIQELLGNCTQFSQEIDEQEMQPYKLLQSTDQLNF